MINATMAHNKSTMVNDKLPEKQLKTIEDVIGQAIEKGKYCVNIDYLLYTDNIKLLQDLGYTVQSMYDTIHERSYTNIRW